MPCVVRKPCSLKFFCKFKIIFLFKVVVVILVIVIVVATRKRKSSYAGQGHPANNPLYVPPQDVLSLVPESENKEYKIDKKAKAM